jgi:hypothetical protein
MRKLLLLVGGLALVMATTLAPKPAEAFNCRLFCSGIGGQSCAQQGMACGVVCVPEGWPCTCGCI